MCKRRIWIYVSYGCCFIFFFRLVERQRYSYTFKNCLRVFCLVCLNCLMPRLYEGKVSWRKTFFGARAQLAQFESQMSAARLSQSWRSRQLLQVSVPVLLLPSSPSTQCSRRGEGLHKGTHALTHVTERRMKPLWAAGSFLRPT